MIGVRSGVLGSSCPPCRNAGVGRGSHTGESQRADRAFSETLFSIARSGERIVIDGPCLSACTLVLMTVPRERICVTPRAVLGFHAASSQDYFGRRWLEPEATDAVLQAYPRPVRQWILRKGGLSPRMLLLHGRELAAMYRRCR